MIPRLFFVGTAGAGKSLLVKSFKEWMESMTYDSITLNLDPGAEYLPYTPDVDIKEYISLESVMEEYNLGPNGAQIAAADLVIREVESLKELIDSYDSDYVLIDTPGQLELFAFRESSSQLMKSFGEDSSAVVYLFDSLMMRNPESYISSRFLGLSVMARFYVPFLTVVSKSDLLEPSERQRIENWDKKKGDLMESLRSREAALNVQLSEGLLQSTDLLNILGESVFSSSESSEGMGDIYNFAQKIFYGSEDLEPR